MKSVFEYKEQRSLISLFHKQDPHFDNTQRLIILYGISCVIEYLHSKNVILHFLDPDHILLEKNYYPFLFYFMNTSLCWTSEELPDHFEDFHHNDNCIFAPEFYNDFEKFYNSPCTDVFAYSILVFTMLTGYPPFRNMKKIQIISFLSENKRPDIPDFVPENWRKLINNCWDAVTENRPTFSQICDILESDDFVNDEINKADFLKYKDMVKPFRPSIKLNK